MMHTKTNTIRRRRGATSAAAGTVVSAGRVSAVNEGAAEAMTKDQAPMTKGPGRVRQLEVGLKAYAWMNFGHYVARAKAALVLARLASSPNVREMRLGDARSEGELCRRWYDIAMGKEVAA